MTIQAARHDIQALLRSGYADLRWARFWLLTITDASLARRWLAALLDARLVHSAAEVGGSRDAPRHREAAAVAFSHAGLQRLGLQPHAEFPFPTPYASGMGSALRARLLRDGARDAWTWADVADPEPAGRSGDARRVVHMLVVHYAQPAADRPAGASTASAFPDPRATGSGFDALCIDGCPSFLQRRDDGRTVAYEPFGFRDGVAQPVVDGLSDRDDRAQRAAAGALYDDRLVAPGEFVLGHENQYGEPSYCPDVIGWPAGGAARRFGTNASYLAVRQIRQHVDAFRRHDSSAGVPQDPGNPHPPVTAAEKLMGRRKDADGTPLAWRPDAPGEPDAFRYRVADANGFQCPRGAHVRRANPRDTLGADVESGIAASKLHRLLRRGRSYRVGEAMCGECGESTRCGADAQRDAGCGDGMFFIACNADLDRQYEFVQQRWLSCPQFGDLADEDDPLVGASATRRYSMPGLPVGARLEELPAYTQTLGGGYFLLPGLAALRFLCADRGDECGN